VYTLFLLSPLPFLLSRRVRHVAAALRILRTIHFLASPFLRYLTIPFDSNCVGLGILRCCKIDSLISRILAGIETESALGNCDAWIRSDTQLSSERLVESRLEFDRSISQVAAFPRHFPNNSYVVLGAFYALANTSVFKCMYA